MCCFGTLSRYWTDCCLGSGWIKAGRRIKFGFAAPWPGLFRTMSSDGSKLHFSKGCSPACLLSSSFNLRWDWLSWGTSWMSRPLLSGWISGIAGAGSLDLSRWLPATVGLLFAPGRCWALWTWRRTRSGLARCSRGWLDRFSYLLASLFWKLPAH